MRRILFAVLLIISVAAVCVGAVKSAPKKVAPVLNFTIDNIDGKPVNLSTFQGDVIMIVNVASLCRYTPQYAGLQKLYDKYKGRGFTILAFPANDFGEQEPGTNPEIKIFCETRYHVTFPLLSKITVKGPGQHPLYRFLTSKTTDPKFGGDIEWNFTKFLINRRGEIVGRFASSTDPQNTQVTAAIERELVAKR